jgi:hypothetical protein
VAGTGDVAAEPVCGWLADPLPLAVGIVESGGEAVERSGGGTSVASLGGGRVGSSVGLVEAPGGVVALPGRVALWRLVPAACPGVEVCEVSFQGIESLVGLGPPDLERRRCVWWLWGGYGPGGLGCRPIVAPLWVIQRWWRSTPQSAWRSSTACARSSAMA